MKDIIKHYIQLHFKEESLPEHSFNNLIPLLRLFLDDWLYCLLLDQEYYITH